MGVILCAHRGASGLAPENTRAALEKAIALGAPMAEVDLQPTADGQLVVFHDRDLDRTSDGRGPLGRRTLAELRDLDVGAWFSPEFAGERILSLNELAELARDRINLNLEFKAHGPTDGLAGRVARALVEAGLAGNCLVTSFDHDLIEDLHSLLPGQRLGRIVGRDGWRDALLGGPFPVLSLEHTLITAQRAARILDVGKEIHAWTVDDPGVARRLAALGVRVLITNHPEIAHDENGTTD